MTLEPGSIFLRWKPRLWDMNVTMLSFGWTRTLKQEATQQKWPPEGRLKLFTFVAAVQLNSKPILQRKKEDALIFCIKAKAQKKREAETSCKVF